MLDIAKLSELVTIAFEAIECEISNSSFLTDSSYTIVEARKRLTLVMEAIKKEPEYVDIDTLRYVVYLGMASYRFFENSPLEN
ncbi:MAG: hypothetical protein FWH36_01270, partial [Lentimicrobiaceae bacterium]|nr:hypothetical protein [Lentimicrobiaceae bacterium]